MEKLVIRMNPETYDNVCTYLTNDMGFEIINLNHDSTGSIKSKQEAALDGVKGLFGIVKNISRLRNGSVIVSIGSYTSLFLLFLNKIHIIHPRAYYWWGFFIHSKKMQKVISPFLKVSMASNSKIILFSECEKSLYSENLGLNKDSFVSIAYGDWGGQTPVDIDQDMLTPRADYYFAGGYSNRDYKALLSTWTRNMPDKKLVIVGSKHNRDLIEFMENDASKYDNIDIHLDVTSSEFDSYMIGARAVIFPFKSNTGASGQSVTLRCMKLQKIIVSSDTDIMREYVNNNVSGYLLSSFETQLRDTLERIEAMNSSEKETLLRKQQEIFDTKFSYTAITARLKEVLES